MSQFEITDLFNYWLMLVSPTKWRQKPYFIHCCIPSTMWGASQRPAIHRFELESCRNSLSLPLQTLPPWVFWYILLKSLPTMAAWRLMAMIRKPVPDGHITKPRLTIWPRFGHLVPDMSYLVPHCRWQTWCGQVLMTVRSQADKPTAYLFYMHYTDSTEIKTTFLSYSSTYVPGKGWTLHKQGWVDMNIS